MLALTSQPCQLQETDYFGRAEHFSVDPDVLGIFASGSLAAGTSDVYSDIDLRVVVRHERHSWFVEHRRDFPKQWPGFWFNEWMPVLVTVFRISTPSSRSIYSILMLRCSCLRHGIGSPMIILHDPENVVSSLVDRSKVLNFTVAADDIDFL